MSHHRHEVDPRHEPTSDEMRPKEAAPSAASKLFDLRILIGGLFTLYGVMLTIYGFFTSPEQLAKAAGININLWLGLGMLILGLLFLLWARLSPLRHEVPPEGAAASDRPPMH